MSNPTTISSSSEVFSLPYVDPTGTDDNSALSPRRQTFVAQTDNPATWLRDARITLERLGSLKPNWDSYGANPISADSCKQAEVLLSRLAHIVNIPAPLVSATPDGHVGFCWDAGSWSLDAWIENTGRITYTYLDEANSANDREAWTDNWQVLARLLTQW